MKPDRGFAQTDLDTHTQWVSLTRKHPISAALVHALIALADKRNAVVASQGVLAGIVGCSERSINRAIRVLEEGSWIQRGRLGPTGTISVYFLNSRVCWKDARNRRGLLVETGNIVLSIDEQDEVEMNRTGPLHRVDRIALSSVLPTVPGIGEQLTLDGILADVEADRSEDAGDP